MARLRVQGKIAAVCSFLFLSSVLMSASLQADQLRWNSVPPPQKITSNLFRGSVQKGWYCGTPDLILKNLNYSPPRLISLLHYLRESFISTAHAEKRPLHEEYRKAISAQLTLTRDNLRRNLHDFPSDFSPDHPFRSALQDTFEVIKETTTVIGGGSDIRIVEMTEEEYKTDPRFRWDGKALIPNALVSSELPNQIFVVREKFLASFEEDPTKAAHGFLAVVAHEVAHMLFDGNVTSDQIQADPGLYALTTEFRARLVDATIFVVNDRVDDMTAPGELPGLSAQLAYALLDSNNDPHFVFDSLVTDFEENLLSFLYGYDGVARYLLRQMNEHENEFVQQEAERMHLPQGGKLEDLKKGVGRDLIKKANKRWLREFAKKILRSDFMEPLKARGEGQASDRGTGRSGEGQNDSQGQDPGRVGRGSARGPDLPEESSLYLDPKLRGSGLTVQPDRGRGKILEILAPLRRGLESFFGKDGDKKMVRGTADPQTPSGGAQGSGGSDPNSSEDNGGGQTSTPETADDFFPTGAGVSTGGTSSGDSGSGSTTGGGGTGTTPSGETYAAGVYADVQSNPDGTFTVTEVYVNANGNETTGASVTYTYSHTNENGDQVWTDQHGNSGTGTPPADGRHLIVSTSTTASVASASSSGGSTEEGGSSGTEENCPAGQEKDSSGNCVASGGGDDDDEDGATCDPACAEGETCQNGECVADSEGGTGGDGGTMPCPDEAGGCRSGGAPQGEPTEKDRRMVCLAECANIQPSPDEGDYCTCYDSGLVIWQDSGGKVISRQCQQQLCAEHQTCCFDDKTAQEGASQLRNPICFRVSSGEGSRAQGTEEGGGLGEECEEVPDFKLPFGGDEPAPTPRPSVFDRFTDSLGRALKWILGDERPSKPPANRKMTIDSPRANQSPQIETSGTEVDVP